MAADGSGAARPPSTSTSTSGIRPRLAHGLARAAGRGHRVGVLLPIGLLLLAALPAAVVAYGTDPSWARVAAGLDVILLSRRLQWPMVALSLAACVALIGLVIAGRRR